MQWLLDNNNICHVCDLTLYILANMLVKSDSSNESSKQEIDYSDYFATIFHFIICYQYMHLETFQLMVIKLLLS